MLNEHHRFWQGVRDSNPRKRSQSPVCYRYTNPLNALAPKRKYYYSDDLPFVKRYFSKFRKTREKFQVPFFLPWKNVPL